MNQGILLLSYILNNTKQIHLIKIYIFLDKAPFSIYFSKFDTF
jgi:hypothetical protein